MIRHAENAEALSPYLSGRRSAFLTGPKVLVAGGSGNVGRNIVAALLEAGAEVIVPTRTADKRDEIRARHPDSSVSLKTLVGDITDEADGPRLLDDARPDRRPLDAAVASLNAFNGSVRLRRS